MNYFEIFFGSCRIVRPGHSPIILHAYSYPWWYRRQPYISIRLPIGTLILARGSVVLKQWLCVHCLRSIKYILLSSTEVFPFVQGNRCSIGIGGTGGRRIAYNIAVRVFDNCSVCSRGAHLRHTFQRSDRFYSPDDACIPPIHQHQCADLTYVFLHPVWFA